MSTRERRHTHPFRSRTLLAAAVAAALAAPTAGWTQSADATLRGTATANADVTAKNLATGAVRRTKAAADGIYVLVGLPPGTYRVDAGPGTEKTVTLSVASTSTLNFAVAETELEEVVVEGSRLREVLTSEIGTIVSLQQIQTVPQLTRNFLEFADTVPGVVFSVDAKGRTSIRGGAQNDNSVNVYIDGVGQKGYVRSGLSGQTDNSQGNPFPQLAIGEYKVITSNYKAEFDQVSSAAITAETRSGTNEFEGNVFYTYTDDGMRSKTPAEEAADRKTKSETKEYGVAFGGPIIQDALHFFMTYEAKRYTTPVTVTPASSPPPDILAQLPPEAAAQLGPATLPFDEDLFFVKLDWALTDRDHIAFSSKIRQEESLGDQAGTGTAASASIQTDNDDNRFDLRWQHNADRWFNEVIFTYEDAQFHPHLSNANRNGSNYTYKSGGNDLSILITDGSDPRAGQDKGQKGWGIQEDITFPNLDFWTGDHTVKAGVKFKEVKLNAQDAIVNNPVFSYDVSASGTEQTPWRAVFANPVEGFNEKVESDDRQFGIYLQDDWAVNNKLTLNIGLRWDYEENPSYLDYKTPQVVLDALNTVVTDDGLTYGETLGLSDDPNTRYNINDYISNGHNRSAQTDQWQPRLGFSYDLQADERHVVFGGYGRSYDRNLYDYLQLEQTKIALGQAEVRFDVPSHDCGQPGTGNCLAWDPIYLQGVEHLQALVAGAPGEVNLINNDLKTPYSDQFSLGMRNRVADWNTSAAVTYIESKDGFVFTLGNRRPDGSFWGPVPWGGPAQPWLYPPPGLNGNLIIGNNGIETRSTQILLSADKPFTEESRWGATLAYTYTDAEQNRDINEHYAFDEVSIEVYPFITSNAAAEHRFVGTFSFQAPWDIMIGAKLTLESPKPGNTVTCYPGDPDGGLGQAFPTGGQCKAVALKPDGDGYQSLDLQVTKNIRLWGDADMYVRLDLLNVTNHANLVDYQYTSGPNGLFNDVKFNEDGNITGPPRQARLTVGAKF
jgi:outer membrane receptor protein involved in Fe transport